MAKGNFGTYWGLNGIVHINIKDPTIQAFYALEHRTNLFG